MFHRNQKPVTELFPANTGRKLADTKQATWLLDLQCRPSFVLLSPPCHPSSMPSFVPSSILAIYHVRKVICSRLWFHRLKCIVNKEGGLQIGLNMLALNWEFSSSFWSGVWISFNAIDVKPFIEILKSLPLGRLSHSINPTIQEHILVPKVLHYANCSDRRVRLGLKVGLCNQPPNISWIAGLHFLALNCSESVFAVGTLSDTHQIL